MSDNEITKAEIKQQALISGVEFVGFVPAERWNQFEDVPVAGYPQIIWPQTKTVIVLGIPILPVISLPAAVGLEEWRVENELLDSAAYRLAVFLNRQGYPSVNIPADSSGETIPEYKTVPVFSHFWAGYYAGIGYKNQREDLSRLHLASVLTALNYENIRSE